MNASTLQGNKMDREEIASQWDNLAAQCHLIADLLRVRHSQQTLGPASDEFWRALEQFFTFLLNVTKKYAGEETSRGKGQDGE